MSVDMYSLTFNQQVAAEIVYRVLSPAALAVRRASPLFNLLAAPTPHLMRTRKWFAFDHDAKAEQQIRERLDRVISEPAEVALMMKRLRESGAESLPAVRSHRDLDPGELAALLNGACGTIALDFPADMPAAAAARSISDNVPFPKLSSLLLRFNRILHHEERGGLSSVRVHFSPAFL